EAVQRTPPDVPDLPIYLSNLGAALNTRFALTGHEEDSEEAIRLHQQAVQATPPDSPDLPMYLNNLGTGLSDRVRHTGQEADLDEAIQSFRMALQAAPPSSPDVPMYLTNFGNGLRDRFARGGREADLDEAILVYQRAVQATPPDTPNLPERLNSLRTGLSDRFARRGQDADLEELIRVYQHAVRETPSGSPELSIYLANLGNVLRLWFMRTGQEADLEEAIRTFRQALNATQPDSPELPSCLNNLGNGLRDRFERTGREPDLEEAIREYRQAVETTPPGSRDLPVYLSNLGNGLSDRFGRTGREADLEEAIRLFRRACQLGAIGAPQAVLTSARNWGSWAFQRKQWSETAEAYGYGLTTGRQLLAHQLLREQKESWLRALQEMSGPAAYALAKLSQYGEAAAMMERGRARLLAEALQRRRRDLEQLPARGHAELYRRYREIVQRQEQLTPDSARPHQPDFLSGQAQLDAIIAANVAFEMVVADIQKISGYADFLAEPTFSQIQAAADPPLAYLLVTPAGGLALLVNAHTVEPVWLDSLTDEAVRNWLWGPADKPAKSSWLGAYQNWLIEHTQQSHRLGLKRAT